MRANLPLGSMVAVALLLSAPASGQTKQRMAAFPFDNRTGTNSKDLGLESKLADALIATLSATGSFTIIDRQYLDRILAEKNLKYDPNFDSAAAAKIGLLGTVDFIVAGQIDAYTANTTTSSSGALGAKMDETDGVVTLRATARLINIERGSIVGAPSAQTSVKGVLAKNLHVAKIPFKIPGKEVTTSQGTTNTDQALRALVDKAVGDVATQLASKVNEVTKSIESTSGSTTAVAANPPPVVPPARDPPPSAAPPHAAMKPKLVSANAGKVIINKGSSDGVKSGDKFNITRITETTMKDPETGKLLVSHKVVCKLVIIDVDETFSSGTCKPDPTSHSAVTTPKSGDEIVPAGE